MAASIAVFCSAQSIPEVLAVNNQLLELDSHVRSEVLSQLDRAKGFMKRHVEEFCVKSLSRCRLKANRARELKSDVQVRAHPTCSRYSV